MTLTLVVLAAGLSSRFGSAKQLVPVGPSGEALLDYALFDAARAGFGRAVLVIRAEAEPEFRAHLTDISGEILPVRTVHQAPAPGRAKPWGTGHAVLAAMGVVDGPFAVCNADDFYGASAYRQLGDHLAAQPPDGPEHALVAFRLRGTLSPHGGVSRAIVERDGRGYLQRLTEVREVMAGPDGIVGSSSGGKPLKLGGQEPASMNLWGFMPALWPVLEEQFSEFLERSGTDPAAEFYLSEAVGDQAVTRRASVRVLEARDRWFGMTVAADADLVRQAIDELVAGGVYPRDLREGFRNL